MSLPDLLRTRIHIARIAGRAAECESGYELHTPAAPTFFHGNCVVLKRPPREVASLRERFAESYGATTRHALFVWGGEPLTGALLSRAQTAGFVHMSDGSMTLETEPAPDNRWTVRPLRGPEAALVEDLERAADGSDSPGGDRSYAEFKRQVAELNRSWIRSGCATWWGAFDGDALVGTCGFVHCDSTIGKQLGRFQAVAVHPDARRMGVASSLVATVARNAFSTLDCPRVVLEMDPHGPAASLYARIGFRPSGDVHSLLWSASALNIRSETRADIAGVQALVAAAFGQEDEAQIVRELRDEPDVLSIVAERDGSLLGHVLFSPVRVVGTGGVRDDAMALGPIAVRPESQRTGVGLALARAGLDRCRAQGHATCFVLGSPAFYEKLGFEPASDHGWTCAWPEAGDAFQSILLNEGREIPPAGRVHYHRAFGDS